MRRLMATSVVAVLLAAPALAQTTTTEPVNPAAPPAAPSATPTPPTTPDPGTAKTTTTTTTPATAPAAINFVSTQAADQLLSTNLVGQNVYGPNREKVGDINNLVLDAKGTVVAAIIGVGGFLGIGEKDVAVPYSAIKWVKPQDNNASSNTNGNELHIDATKDQLKAAPTFERYRDRSSAKAPVTP